MDFTKINDYIQKRLDEAYAKSNVLTKTFGLIAIVFFTFFLRVSSFIRIRGANDLYDIFNLGMTDTLASTGISSFFSDDDSSAPFPGLVKLIAFTQFILKGLGLTFPQEILYTIISPFFASLIVILTYLLGKQVRDETTGLVAAGILSILPGFFAQTLDGRAANAVVGTFFVLLALYYFSLSLTRSSTTALVYAVLAGASYGILSFFWAGYIILSYALAGYVAFLLFIDRATPAVQTAFSVFFVVGTGITLLQPAVFGFAGFLKLEQIPVIAVFVSLQLSSFVPDARKLIGPILGAAAIGVVAIGAAGILPTSRGFSIFLSQLVFPTESASWVTFYRDLHLMLFLFPAGALLALRNRTTLSLLLVFYSFFTFLLASFSTSYSLVLFPAVAILAASSLIVTLRVFLKHQDAPSKKRSSALPVNKEIGVAVIAGILAIVGFYVVFSLSSATHPTVFKTTTTLPVVSQSTNSISWLDDFREAYSWISHNIPKAKIASWTGIGHQITLLAGASPLGSSYDSPDPAALSLVTKALQSEEADAAEIIKKQLGADYILVVFGGHSGFARDDINSAYASINPIDSGFVSTESALYKLSYKGFADAFTKPQTQPGFDLARKQPVTVRPVLENFEEVFTSENWVIRIYKVKQVVREEPKVEA